MIDLYRENNIYNFFVNPLFTVHVPVPVPISWKNIPVVPLFEHSKQNLFVYYCTIVISKNFQDIEKSSMMMVTKSSIFFP